MDKRLYKVLEVSGHSGLTVGSRVIKAGKTFTREAWPYGEKALIDAIKKKRCVEVKIAEKKGEEKKDPDKKDKEKKDANK